MVRSDLCDYSDAYIVIKGDITVTSPTNDTCDKNLAFKNNALFISCISKINNTLIDNAEDLDILMLMFNLLDTEKIIEKLQEVYGIITEIKQIVEHKEI